VERIGERAKQEREVSAVDLSPVLDLNKEGLHMLCN